ncbi:MAG: protein kinase [Deltaproteobacteria bacterium]|nr:protein kinase [Deltaproteobacteria bacterium]MBW2531892.1 protein kinase [Deltaproteobacteria bacterium]
MELPIERGEILDGKYAVEDVIGEGGMGCVYAARHVDLDTPVAVKVLRPDASDDSRHRFLREARAASRIDNEHVARVFDVGKLADGTPFMVMELLEGRDLDDLLYEEDRPLPIATAVGFALQACEALAAAHRRGVVHRDVKPANLFITSSDLDEPCIKLLDFGISKMPAKADAGSDALTLTGSCLGSPLFMSPEQLLSCRSVDRRSDLWSLGVSLFELLTRSAAFEGQTVAELYSAILRDPPRRLRDYRPDAPVELEMVILRCLQKEPELRVQSAEELADLLRPFASAEPSLPEAPPSADPVIEWTVLPSSPQAGWVDTEIMDRPLPPVGDEQAAPESWESESMPEASLHPAADAPAELTEEIDQTPAGTVRPVAAPSAPSPGRRWLHSRPQVAGALVVAGLVAGGVLGAAASSALSSAPDAPPRVLSSPHFQAAPVVVVTARAPAPTVAADPSPLVYSTQLSESQRERLLQEVSAAEHELELGEHERVLARVDAVVGELATLGVEPHKANSSIGARAQLLVARIEAAKARQLLSEPPTTFRDARSWSKRLEERVARARVAYDRVITWGVRSFYRCGLVEMAALDRDVAPVFRDAAPPAPGPQRDWYLAVARRHLKRARVALRTALHVQSETMLCVDAAQQALDQIKSDLALLSE